MTESIINFVEKRNEAIEQRRREFERIFFKNFLGVYIVLESEISANSAQIVDISEKGLLLQMPHDRESMRRYHRGIDLNLRIYFTPTAYLPIGVCVKYVTEYLDSEGVQHLRFGCEFDREGSTFEAIESFVEFLNKFAEHSCSDRQDHRNAAG
jgi:hypothetical protein